MRSLRSFLVVAGATGGIAIWATPGCGSSNNSFFDGGDNGDSGLLGDADPCSLDPFSCTDAGPAGDAPPPCTGLACQVVQCGGGGHTSISGTVYDPAGKNPLYNVYVYVPNAPLQAIPSGPMCTSCQAPASGSPIVGTQSNPDGSFTLNDVPVGTGIPLVMQLGKFRREIMVDTVTQCVDNKVGKKDGSGNETLTRMPRKQAEGSPNDNIPKIAMATGSCDALECLMRKIGIDDSEFTNPAGRVHIYTGDPSIGGTAAASYSTDAQTTLWNSHTTMEKYDIVMNSCECQPTDRGNDYKEVHQFLSDGGRFFGTHFHYNWFAPPTGPADFQATANWPLSDGSDPGPFYINTTIPKGVAFDQWMQAVWKAGKLAMTQPAPPKGGLNIDAARHDVGTVKGATTPWIYYTNSSIKSSNYETAYLSFNTPTAAMVDQQCGRAVFSDIHVSSAGGFGGTTFPAECDSNPMTQQEAALEFLFFDLSSCVGDDTKPPPPPPPN